ncbi:MAG: acylphosphatase [Candidatus Colwellbacteria bacterium]|nr:acylphosphatase [Candidatus Colwellbacteria bacterium]
MKHIDIIVKGKAQGVFFRHFAQKRAEELGIKGFAENLPDGSVYIEAEGEEENLKNFIDWCHQGSPLAQVKSVGFKYNDNLKEFKNFITK